MDGGTESKHRSNDMTYVAGFLTPLPDENREACI